MPPSEIIEMLARSQHAQWLRNEHAKGITEQQNPNMKPWEELDDAQREDNRRFAEDLQTKLGLIGAIIAPAPPGGADEQTFRFSADELELLAEHEHRRWMKARIEASWRYGVPRDDANKIHDQLKPWKDLDEPNRDKDRNAVREIPEMLGRAGFRIHRRA